MLTVKIRLLAIVLFLTVSVDSLAQEKTEKDKINSLKTMIDSKQYRFNAMTANTAKGKTIQLTSEYSLRLNRDTLQVDLPYYGRAYSADYGGTDLSIQFNSTNFSYTADTTKKGGWEITIIPMNESKANKIYMSVSSGGYCNMNVLSNSRQSISFYGTIEALKK